MSPTTEQEVSQFKLAFMINIVSPYRVPIFQLLGIRFRLRLLLSGVEDNRGWEQSSVSGVQAKKSFGWTLKGVTRTPLGATAEQRYLHINPGYAWDLLTFRPDAVISTEMGIRSLTALIHGLVFRVPVWIWWEGGDHSNRMRQGFKIRSIIRRQIFARFARQWVCFGSHSADYIESLGVDRASILQLQLPVDERIFQSSSTKYPIKVSHPRALFVGRIIYNKGIYQLIEATAQLQAEGVDIALVIVGDGPESTKLSECIHLSGIKNVEWIPWLPPDQMPSVYQSCDFLVLPTLDDVWGLVVNEAIASGLPVIASKFAGCAQDLLSEENIFDPLDSTSMLEAMRRAVDGAIAPATKTHLQPISEVAERIANEILVVLRK